MRRHGTPMLLYRCLISLFALGVLSRAAWGQGKDAVAARLGGGAAGGGQPRLWLHAASNGELASARPVIEALQAARPDLPLIVTCNTETGCALARRMGLEARLAPLDLGWAVARFLRGWGVVGHITLESELWPNRIARMPGPVIVLGGRLTAKSAKGWGRVPGLARRMLARVDLLSAQDAGSRDRFLALGLPQAAAGPVVDLKALYKPPSDMAPEPDLAAAYPRARTWLAASTHPGEEEVVIAAHLSARAAEPELRLILAPRHPRRADAVASMLEAAGLSVSRRSRGEAGAEVLLADTMGEMARWYALAGRVFIGGTLTDRGGHTPFEPAAFGAALLHGPDVANFARPFARLDRGRAARAVEDAEGLAAALTALAAPDAQTGLGGEAAEVLRPEADLDALVAAILARFRPASGTA
ncbi:3-deoxy-D-manno-octulosonic-acid transferase [Roseivivax lentus]|uniref:3-deoxy-D-manno-octulosonic acid transferase n=1 Tax=Roseivivax lentus TaxID=633194 RepID=A0A1N7NM55_9RHOB|nr:glycosyltransferase N-terminal domain-containing protein [Roseivivax lentus]SIS99350.1 3-deoxy-D-manno-octulosonic-acid transferase [Roseivivax lentus]